MHRKGVLEDTHQGSFALSAIQLSGWTSLPILATSLLVLQDNTFYGAALTIVVGNALLWFIRLIIVVMSHKDRQSTLDLAKGYLGKFGGYGVAVLCLLSSLLWFVAQTTAGSESLVSLMHLSESAQINQFIQVSVVLGVVSTLFCLNGIVLLRHLSVVAFPLLLLAFAAVFWMVPFEWPQGGAGKLSLSGLGLVMGVNLGITADLPTFFRHSKSLLTSVVALTWIQLLSLVLALGSLFLGSVITDTFTVNELFVDKLGNGILHGGLITLVVLSVICANVANVYSASVGWEILAPAALVGKKEYLILGLGLTIIFILISGLFSIQGVLKSSDAALINLCLVFLMGYFVTRFKRKGPDRFEQSIYFGAWVLASLCNILQYAGLMLTEVSPLLTGFFIIACVIFLGMGLRIARFSVR